ncbi:N-acetylmuramoyl-L-alanine amidase family protein [Chitinophaga costaii]|nr:N-acetylmuramoyl-L-alanine amidase [Chitinophaga costaii]
MRRKRFWIFTLGTVLVSSLFIFATTGRKKPYRHDKPIHTIVIDAGHGGEDAGARGSYSTEKQITLAVALKLGKMIEDNMPDVKVVYTRTTDRYDDVHRKAEIANDAHGDLFVSIHCNSTVKVRKTVGYKTVTRKKGKRKIATKVPIYAYYPSEAKGTETYVWATSKNNAKLESLKQHSSSVIVLDDDSSRANMDPTDPATYIMLNTLRNAYFDQSLRLSSIIEDEFTKTGRLSRGARQRNEKGIWVLSGTAMPSVLVEVGFISNPEEEDFLNSQEGQMATATSIYNAIQRYKEELERFGAPTSNDLPTPTTRNKKHAPVKDKTLLAAATAKRTPASRPSSLRNKMEANLHSRKASNNASRKPAKSDLAASKAHSRNDIAAVPRGKQGKERMASARPGKKGPPTPSSRDKLRQREHENIKNALAATGSYKVQVMSCPTSYPPHAKVFAKLKATIVKETIAAGRKKIYKYYCVNYKTFAQANAALHNAKKLGFKDAFILDRNGSRLEARL